MFALRASRALLATGATAARARPAGPATAAPRRRMGGLTDVKKNAHIEEWNGRREITEKTFDVGKPKTIGILLASLIAFPALVHHLVKSELDNSKNNCINPKTRAQGTC
mmetsp:Transcript_31901/g.98410  ORF Transcript_31901/g.98410 Transcript_31901/m.98410 type:complete len:109 (+) Transcript_31901:210-536(+)